jgi:hypothetical protein
VESPVLGVYLEALLHIALWDVTPCILLSSASIFRTDHFCAMIMEAAGTSENQRLATRVHDVTSQETVFLVITCDPHVSELCCCWYNNEP